VHNGSPHASKMSPLELRDRWKLASLWRRYSWHRTSFVSFRQDPERYIRAPSAIHTLEPVAANARSAPRLASPRSGGKAGVRSHPSSRPKMEMPLSISANGRMTKAQAGGLPRLLPLDLPTSLTNPGLTGAQEGRRHSIIAGSHRQVGRPRLSRLLPERPQSYKDRMRLMMQALLVDRFKIKVHFEEAKVLRCVGTRPRAPGETGPKRSALHSEVHRPAPEAINPANQATAETRSFRPPATMTRA